MRQAFAHEAVLSPDGEVDEDAPGAAVTVALCGHWQHEPPCPLAPHHVRSERAGDDLRIRVLFATEPENEREVRRRVERALSGEWPLPEGFAAPWRLTSSRPVDVAPEETEHLERLIGSPPATS